MRMATARPKRKAAQKITTYTEVDHAEDADGTGLRIASTRTNRDPVSVEPPAGAADPVASVKVVTKPSNGGAAGNNSSGRATPSKEPGVTFIRSDIPNNWQPPLARNEKFPSLLNLSETTFVDGAKTAIKSGDGTIISKEDHIYMVLEPANEPYYIARIMGFFKKRNLKSNANLDAVENYQIKVNWYYRPRDILRLSSDSRVLYATMHTDLCPITSFRGKAIVKHRDEIDDLSAYRCKPAHFWFEKLFDRYMIKYYDLLPTRKLTNLPENYQKALRKRFGYVFVEAGRGDDLLVTPKNCVKCNQWCSMSDSVECAKCNDWYHMLCLSPPLLKKPSRGYSWSCAKCTKETDDEMRRIHIDNLKRKKLDKKQKQPTSSQESEVSLDKMEEDEEELSLKKESPPPQIPMFEKLAIEFLEHDKDLTLEQRRAKEEWPYRYLGMHARLEDALDVEDRPYPRASSRLGTKHQANIGDWLGHAEVYYDRDEAEASSGGRKKAKYKKRGSKDKESEKSKETDSNSENPLSESPSSTSIKKLDLPVEFKQTPPKELPLWLKPRPHGYLERGLDDGTSSTLMWKQPVNNKELDNQIDFFVFKRCRPIAKELKVFPNTPNFLDAIFKTLLDTNFDFEKSFLIIKGFTRQLLKEPTFSDDEVKRFEEGVKMYGSELLPVHRHVGTQSFAMVVRFYYLWKKTPNGHLIWDNFEGRKNKKVKKNKSNECIDSIADADDDSSYDKESSSKQRRQYECKHCKNTKSFKWFRAPGHLIAPADPKETVIGLCFRCARLWRLYAVIWEDPLEVSRKINQKGNAIWKKKVEHELAQDATRILEEKEKAKVARTFNVAKRKSSSPSPDETVVIKKQKGVKNGLTANAVVTGVDTKTPSFKVTVKQPKSKAGLSKEIKAKKEDQSDDIAIPDAPTSSQKKPTQVKKEKESLTINIKRSNLQSNSANGSGEKKSSVRDIAPKETSVEPAIHYLYNQHYTYNFENFDPKSHEFDNALPDPKDDYVIPLSVKTKSSNSKDSPGMKHIISANGLFSPDRRPCCVCRSYEESDINEILICSNCGLNVHSTCYGVSVEPDVKMYTKEWCCDSCSNDLHPIGSTYYGCSLCYSKEIDHDSAIVGGSTAFPDALKRTTNFKWSHVLCSLFSPDIKFEDAKTMQGIINMPVCLVKNEFKFCDICNIKSGSLKKCLLCDSNVHATCAQDSANYFLGFRLISELEHQGYSNVFEGEKSRKVVKVVNSGAVGVPQPVIVCSHHDQQEAILKHKLFPFREKAVWLEKDKQQNDFKPLALIQLYVEGFMQWEGKFTGPALRYYENALIKEEVHKMKIKEKITANKIRLAKFNSNEGDEQEGPALLDNDNGYTPMSYSMNDTMSHFSGIDNDVPQCSNKNDGSHYCNIISRSNWWETDLSPKSAACTFCADKNHTQEAVHEKKHYKDFDNVKINGELYGVTLVDDATT